MNSSVAERPPSHKSSGLIRDTLAGRGRTLADAFKSLEECCDRSRALRHVRRDLFSAKVPIDPLEGSGHWELTRVGRAIHVIVQNLTYHQARLEFVPGDDTVQFYFSLAGDLTMGLGGSGPVRVNRPSLLVIQSPRGADFEEWTVASTLERCVAISINREFLMEEFFADVAGLPSVLGALMDANSPHIQYRECPLNGEMAELARCLIDNEYDGPMRLIYTEAVTLQLLCLAVSGLRKVVDAQASYSDRDLRSLHAARALLMDQLSTPLTIREIARLAGTNETSLKRGFKSLFGQTVFDFATRCRMEHAMTLLRESRIPIARVAEAVGYGHQASFATAFRRYFGMSPKDARSPIAH